MKTLCIKAGMGWSKRGLNVMLRLLCTWASDRWDDTFAGELSKPPPPDNVNDFKKPAKWISPFCYCGPHFGCGIRTCVKAKNHQHPFTLKCSPVPVKLGKERSKRHVLPYVLP